MTVTGPGVGGGGAVDAGVGGGSKSGCGVGSFPTGDCTINRINSNSARGRDGMVFEKCTRLKRLESISDKCKNPGAGVKQAVCTYQTTEKNALLAACRPPQMRYLLSAVIFELLVCHPNVYMAS